MRRELHVRFCEGGGVRFPSATRLVVFTRHEPSGARQYIERILGKLGLTLSETKTRVVDALRTTFDFLGHTVKLQWGRVYLDIAPKSRARIRDEIRRRTVRYGASMPTLVDELNSYIRGARNYFRRVVRRRLAKLDHFVTTRIARWARRKYSRVRPPWSLVEWGALRNRHGLEMWWLPRGVA
jgi:RNA-directed DNA polymerase